MERASTQALAATRSMIESAVAPPTLEQARVIGVESMVEGVEWHLSTQQLHVRGCARRTQKISNLTGFRLHLYDAALISGAELTPRDYFRLQR